MSTNNLKRHIAEIHKNEINYQEPPKIIPETYLYCRHCDKTFETRKIWVEHKIEDAKIMKPFSPFEWGCDICGKYWSRKERLVHHMMAHVRDSTPTDGDMDGGANNGFDSQDSDGQHQEYEEEEAENMAKQEEEQLEMSDDVDMTEANVPDEEDIIEEVDEEEEEEDEEFDENQPQVVEAEVDLESEESASSSEEEESDDEEQNGHQDDDESSDSTVGKPLSCDLCQLNFNTQQDLQRHVASHFLNGPGAVTLNERQKTTSTSSSSASSGGTSSTSKEDDNVEELIEGDVQDVSPVIEEDYEDESEDAEDDDEEEEDDEIENA